MTYVLAEQFPKWNVVASKCEARILTLLGILRMCNTCNTEATDKRAKSTKSTPKVLLQVQSTATK